MASRLPSRLLIAARAGFHSLRRRRPPAEPRKILIAHHLLLGDTLMLTPLLAKLRARYPQAEIVMTVPVAFAGLYAGRPYGVEVIPYDPRRLDTTRAVFARGGYDLALIPGDNRYAWLARAAGARWIVAFGGDRPAYKSWPVDAYAFYPGKPAAWGDMTAYLADGPEPPAYRPSQWPAPAHAPFDLPRAPYAVLHLGASTPLKQWRPARWRALAEQLAARGYTVAWSTGPREEALIAAVDPEGRHPAFAGTLALPQLWHLLANAALLVCPDTGVAHLGRLTGTPTVTLFGPGSAEISGAGRFWRDAPYRAVTIPDFPCRNQPLLFRRQLDWVRRCGRSTRECRAPACMEAIELESVWQAADALLSEERACSKTSAPSA